MPGQTTYSSRDAPAPAAVAVANGVASDAARNVRRSMTAPRRAEGIAAQFRREQCRGQAPRHRAFLSDRPPGLSLLRQAGRPVLQKGNLTEPRMLTNEQRTRLGEWVRAVAPRAVAFARSLVRDHSRADDVVQEAFYRLLRKANEYD